MSSDYIFPIAAIVTMFVGLALLLGGWAYFLSRLCSNASKSGIVLYVLLWLLLLAIAMPFFCYAGLIVFFILMPN